MGRGRKGNGVIEVLFSVGFKVCDLNCFNFFRSGD